MGDDRPLAALIGVLVVLLLLSAFFSGSETALMSLNRYQLRHKAKTGHRGARLAETLLKRPDRLIGLILLGNNLVNFSAAALVAIIAFKLGGQPAVAIGTLILTLTVLIFSEAAPKTLAALHPERVAFPAALIYYPLLKITYPLVWLTSIASNGVTVDYVMVPHNEIIGIDLDDSTEEIMAVIEKREHTRLPVFRDNIDNVVGLLHLRRIANHAYRQDFDKAMLETLVEEPYYVPEGTPLSTQLVQFQKLRKRIALVVDEYGDIQGIVTLEDILEEIVGEFTTDPSSSDVDIVRESSSTFLVDGAANIREMNRAMNWSLPTDGPKTLNGLIVEYLETIPKPGTGLKIEGYPIEIVATNENRVKTARIHPRQELPQATSE